MVLVIATKVLREIQSHAEEAYPEECCGLLIATDGKKVVESMRMKNVYPGPRHDRYHIDPLEFYRADRMAGQRGLYVRGIYHSHPDYPASLSSFDLEHSFPWYSYLVMSVSGGRVKDLKSWLANEGRTATSEEPIDIVGDA
jgi:proteasome lid subunit RPN8/RPN11